MKRYIVYGFEHPAFAAEEIGRYRWRWRARLAAWWFEHRIWSLLWPGAWVVDVGESVSLPKARSL